MSSTDQPTFIEQLRHLLTNAPEGVDVSAITAALDALASPDEDRTKLWFLLDRSGSMQRLAEDVIGGFNRFVAEQATKPGKARMTVVQFDGTDPFEVIYDATTVAEIPALTNATYWARGVTPLYDAIGSLIERADQRIADRAKANKPIEDQLVLVFTDGLENASRRYDRAKVFDLIRERQDSNWTFVFMGSNQDSYQEGHKIGLVDGNIQDYDSDPMSVNMAFASMSRSTGEFRGKPRHRRHADKDRFFDDIKEAEEARRNTRT